MYAMNKIVVPVDLEKNTQKLVDFAIYMAKKFNAELNLIHVTEFYSTEAMLLGNPSLGNINAQRMSKAEETMEHLLAENTKKYNKIKGSVLKGEVVDTIVSFAETEQAEMVIIGTHGAKGLEKILLGSVAERVVKRVHCPTLTMNPYK